jgi:16S rRNA (guanine(966)-N(2))-methyltransferase RsmD
LRPTSDKLRETIFNILAPRMAGARVLDGYAGTGALGIEALSRGAASVTFVDQDPRAEALIGENLAACGVKSGYAIIRADFEHACASIGDRFPIQSFDIILLDPPYGRTGASVVSVLAAAGSLLAPHGVVVLEHARRAAAPMAAGRLGRSREYPSGDSILSLYEWTA